MAGTFQSVARGGRRGYAVPDLPRDLLIRLVECPDLPLRMGPAETIKAGDAVLVTRVKFPGAAGPIDVAYKRVERATLLKKLTQMVGPNRARQAFLAGHRLLALGIATARPLAVIVPSRFDARATSWLATEWLGDAENLAALAERCRRLPAAERLAIINAAATAVGELIGRMHAAGVAHRDLKPHNIMVQFNRDRSATAFLVDLDGVRFRQRVPSAVRWKNLSRLAIGEASWRDFGPATRLRFLEAYWAVEHAERAGRAFWQGVATASSKRLARRAA